MLPEQSWGELLHALFVASQSQDPGQRESAFRIFATTPAIIEKQHEDSVVPAFTKGFKDSDILVPPAASQTFSKSTNHCTGQDRSSGGIFFVL